MRSSKLRFLKPVLALLCSAVVSQTTLAIAQIVQPICSFTNSGFSSPRNPGGGLVVGPDGNLYGTTAYGGTGGFGVAFKITTVGALTVLANFGGTTGGTPSGNLALGPDGNFYGTTYFSGPGNVGTIFQLTTNGVLNVLYSFSTPALSGTYDTNIDGANPRAGLALGPDGCFYGTTSQGGSYGSGTIFRVTTNGALTTLFSFGGVPVSPSTNSTGADPYAPLTLGPDGNFYGTTFSGGTIGYGTVFRVTTNGTFTVLTNFLDSNGAEPEGPLTVGPDGSMYGTTLNGGINGDEGTVFKVTTNGLVIRLVSFNYNTGSAPQGGVTFGTDGNLYGTTSAGPSVPGSSSDGTVFRLTTNGVLTALVSFDGTNGSESEAGLTLAEDGNLYGTTCLGGSTDPNAGGEVFRFNPVLAFGTANLIEGSAGTMTLEMPGAFGSTNLLLATTNLTLPVGQWQVIATNVATNGLFQFSDTNTTTCPVKFYRFTSE